MTRKDIEQRVNVFSSRLKSTWQMVVLPSVALYALTLLHFFYLRPALRFSNEAVLRNIDWLSFAAAVVIAVAILRQKQKYFSRRFSVRVTEEILTGNPQADLQTIIDAIFGRIRGKIFRIWLLGVLLISDGLLFYWITYSPGNMHIYSIIGIFSLALNYPRPELFFDIPYYIVEGRRELTESAAAKDKGHEAD